MKTMAGPEASVQSGVAELTAKTDEEAIALARKLIAMLPVNNMDDAVTPSADDVNRELVELNGIDKVDDVRDLMRSIADMRDIVELGEGFAASMVTALGKIGGATVGFIANQAAKDEGRLTVYGCKKAARFAAFCDCFSIPIVTIVDSMGMKISTAPQGELSRTGAQLMFALTEATTVRIALIAGNAVGMGYAAMASRASADMVYAWPGAVISAVTPKIAVQLTQADELKGADDPYAKREELENRYMDDVADGVNAAKLGYVDAVSYTHLFLEYYVDWWEQIQSATPTPAPATATPVPATATPVPATGTPAPTATFAPTNEPEDEHENVDQNSDAESIRFVQQMLIAVGLLDPGEDDGIYGSCLLYTSETREIGTMPETGVATVPTAALVSLMVLAMGSYVVLKKKESC